jgi:hypothetical protein
MIFGEEESQMNPQPQPSPGGQQQIHLDTSHMETVYANFFALAGSPDELVVYMGTNSPLPGVQQPVIPISHRLLLLPANAKRFLMALQQAVKAHEDRFGPIELPPHRRPGEPPSAPGQR